MQTPHEMIYRIIPETEWSEALKCGKFQGSALDIADGFIHFSTKDTVAETLAVHFAGQDGLKLLLVPVASVQQNLRWEVSRNGALFPHLYNVLDVRHVVRVAAIGQNPDGSHNLPDDILQGL